MANASNLNPSGSIFPFQFVLLLYSRRLNQARLWFFQFPFVRFYFWRRKPLIHSVYVYVFFFLYFTHLIHRVQYNLINVVHSFRWATFFFSFQQFRQFSLVLLWKTKGRNRVTIIVYCVQFQRLFYSLVVENAVNSRIQYTFFLFFRKSCEY